MTPDQRHYLSMMVKTRWNDLCYLVDIGEKTEEETEEEYKMMESLFDKVLDDNVVYKKEKD